MLSERQQRLLRILVDMYLDAGEPVGSRSIAAREEITWSPSTVRAELGSLEREGYLTHPHTSAGRVPTDAGYRFYVDSLLESDSPPVPRGEPDLDLSRIRREVDETIQETTAALSRATDLAALVTAPPLGTASIHRVEALLLQPTVVMLVVITSTGEVTRRTFTFDRPVDPGLVDWASSYLHERLTGMDVGARMIAARLDDPELGEAERRLMGRISEALTELDQGPDGTLYIGGTSRLLAAEHVRDLPRVNELVGALERRIGLLAMLRSTLDERSVFSWIGEENPQPELRSASVVGANYGLGYRNLGAVGVVGPVRMDYAAAIASVREAAGELSRYFESVYEG
jgi:heat-inducible transcriptional repressor